MVVESNSSLVGNSDSSLSNCNSVRENLMSLNGYVSSVWRNDSLTLVEKVRIDNNINEKLKLMYELCSRTLSNCQIAERRLATSSAALKAADNADYKSRFQLLGSNPDVVEDNIFKMILSVFLSISKTYLKKPVNLVTSIFKRSVGFLKCLVKGENI